MGTFKCKKCSQKIEYLEGDYHNCFICECYFCKQKHVVETTIKKTVKTNVYMIKEK